MAIRLIQSRAAQSGFQRHSLRILAVGLALCVVARAQDHAPASPGQSTGADAQPAPSHTAYAPSQPPAFTIPVASLGFAPPSSLHLGERWSHTSLDFLGEDRLLFTFRVPGLMRRDSDADDERQIRALVLALPTGIVEAEDMWTLHDHARYLWTMRDGSFLLRDRQVLKQGDATLKLKTLLRFPGPLLWLELDPAEQYLMTNSHEPASVQAKSGEVSSPATAAAGLVVDGQQSGESKDTVVRILRKSTSQVLLVSHARGIVHLPINSEGYIESLRGSGAQWILSLDRFTGGNKVLGRLDSYCAPAVDFVSQQEIAANTCTADGRRTLVTITTDGRTLWENTASAKSAWPILLRSPDGSRLARETIIVSHTVGLQSPLYSEDIKGQLIEVFDAADGSLALSARASLVLDGGGNLAISPSGRRIAILTPGSIQVFELPAASPLSNAASGPSAP